MNNFVTYEQAVILKKLGFDRWGDYIFHDKDRISPVVILSYNYRNRDSCFPAPTLEQAHSWLREKGLLIVPYSMSFESWQCRVCKKGEKFIDSKLYEDFYSYEEALSYGIDECLKILQKEN